MNGRNRVQGVGLVSETVLVGAEPSTVVAPHNSHRCRKLQEERRQIEQLKSVVAFGGLAVPWLVYHHWVVQAGIHYPAWVVDAVL